MVDRGASHLDAATLVLNRSWTAVNVTTVRKAICLVFRGQAKIIAPDTFQVYDFQDWTRLPDGAGHPHIRAVSFSFRTPEVIVLAEYDSVPATEVPFSRRNIFRRDKYVCQYCGRGLRAEHLTVDHIVPRSRGGRASWENCVLACIWCNFRKGDRSPEEAGMALRRPAARPSWQPDLIFDLDRRPRIWSRFLRSRSPSAQAGPEPFYTSERITRTSP